MEIYLNGQWLDRARDIIALGRNFPLRYALHAPADTFRPAEMAELASGLRAEIVVFHDILWDDEWEVIRDTFAALPTRVCVENVATVHQPLKFMRRFGMGFCLDLEHLQMEAGGVFEEEFLRVMEMAFHIHMTGYYFGTTLWHSHIHHAPEHSTNLLNLLETGELLRDGGLGSAGLLPDIERVFKTICFQPGVVEGKRSEDLK